MTDDLEAGRVFLAGAFTLIAIAEAWLYASRRRATHLWGGVAAALVATFLLARWVSSDAGVFLDLALGTFGIALAALFGRHTGQALRALEGDVETRTRELADAAAALEDVLRSLPDVVFVHRASRGIELFSAKARAWWSAAAEVTPARLGATEEDAMKIERILAIAPGDEPVYAQLRLADDAGRAFTSEIVAVGVLVGGEAAVVASARDLSDRAGVERQLRLADRLSSVGTLAAGVAHEINNPMTYVASNIAFVRESLDGRGHPDDEELIQALEDAASGTRRVAAIVKELRQFGHTESSDPTAATDPRKPLTFALDLTGHQLRHSCQVISRVPDALPKVTADEGRLSQVFANLLTNAGDSMPSGRSRESNRILLEVVVEDAFLEVRISDNGAGMAPHELEHVFDPFFSTKGVDGMGLGLSICHNIVSEFGGDLVLESEVGIGTTARVRLPLARGRRRAAGDGAEPATPGIPSILLIDDEPRVLKALSRVLGREHQVTTLTSAQEASKLLVTASFDVILCDLMMPNMTGRELLRWLEEHRPQLVSRFVLFTGGAVGREEQEFLDSTSVVVLRKPLTNAELKATIRRIVDRDARADASDEVPHA